MNAADVAARLVDLPPVELAGPALLARFHALEAAGELTPDALIEFQTDIDAARQQLGRHIAETRRLVKRCLQLTPAPSSTPPPGF